MAERLPDRLDASAQENVCTDTVSGWLWYCDVHDTHGNADDQDEAETLAELHEEFKRLDEGAGGEGCDLMVWRRTPHERTAGE